MPLTTYVSGEVLTAASLNDNFAFAASGGLTVVKAETAFTGQSSFNVPSIFSSTYTNYLINFRWFAATSNGGIKVQLSVAGVAAATAYNYMRVIAYGSSSLAASRSTAQTSFAVASQAASSTGVYQFGQLQLSGPAEANPTMLAVSGALQDGAAYITPDAEIFNGNHATATAYDGLTITAVTGTLTGTYTVYGYAKS